MKILLVPALLCLAACATPSGTPDFFARQSDFAADRSRQTTVVESTSSEEACAQVVAVLMDLDCSLVEVNHRLGLVSGRTNAHLLPPVTQGVPGLNTRSCLGQEVTVSVLPRERGEFAIRASFRQADSRADATFRRLLRKSLALSVQQEDRSE